ncbi:MAG: DJ-1/PfpI family protein [Pikeienuella sp.]|uniref:DJ-1/PfpI family protein n=1 Tax=Pikeienuella sp. TaxID=2831957 RepID=UPI00391CE85F
MKRRTVGALVYPDFELLDLYGPLEMFGMFPDEFALRIVADGANSVPSAQGPRTTVDDLIGVERYDILLVPGGRGTRRDVKNARLLAWLREAAEGAEIVASVCTGSALLARAGLLDGRGATTNKLAFDWVAKQGPKVDWRGRARWVEDGKFWTASGVSAGTDMALALIGRLLGPEKARQAADWAEYTPNEDPANDPFAKEDT